MKCKHPGCLDKTKPWKGNGRKPKYCPKHSQSKYSAQRTRAEITSGPECCRSLGPGRVCDSHKAQRPLSVGPLDPDTIHSVTWDASSPEADMLSDSYNPYRREYLTGVTVMSHTKLSMPVKLDRSGEPYKVIGQRDLDVNWQPVSGELFPEGLIRRGADWPFADMAA